MITHKDKMEEIRNELEHKLVKTKEKRKACQKRYFDLDDMVKHLTYEIEEIDKE